MKKILLLSFFIAFANSFTAQNNSINSGGITDAIPLPIGYSATKVFISTNASQEIKLEFYKKSKGQDSYIVYRDEKGNEVDKELVIARYKEENNGRTSPFTPNAPNSINK